MFLCDNERSVNPIIEDIASVLLFLFPSILSGSSLQFNKSIHLHKASIIKYDKTHINNIQKGFTSFYAAQNYSCQEII